MDMRMLFPRWITTLLAIAVSSCVVSLLVLGDLQRVYVIANHEDAPIEITAFGKYKYEDDNEISSVVEYRNKTSRDIEAFIITMIYFDAFNEREDGVKGVSTNLLPAFDEGMGAWSTYGKPSFVKTAMAFVSAVRFVDGEVWRADTEAVLAEASKLPGLTFLSKTEMLEIEED